MSTYFKERQNVVDFGARRSERTSADNERYELEDLRRQLERERTSIRQERAAMEEERRHLEQAQADFEEELGILEEQRRFLDSQREKLRKDQAALEAEREALGRVQGLASQRQRVESVIENARKLREADRVRLQAEMAGLFERATR